MLRTSPIFVAIGLGIAGWNSVWGAEDAAGNVDTWASRLVKNLRAVLVEDGLKGSERLLLCSSAAHSLAMVGKSEDAIVLTQELLDAPKVAGVLVIIAAAQSASDDVDAAFRTVSMIPEASRAEQARGLIVMRQAQRGDFNESIQLLNRISDPTQLDRARVIVVRELLEEKQYEEAAAQYELVMDEHERERLEKDILLGRLRVGPDHPDYVETMLRIARQTAGLSSEEAQLLRIEYEGNVAIYNHDNEAFSRAVEKARSLIVEWPSKDRIKALLSSGKMSAEGGQPATAGNLYREALENVFEAGQGNEFLSFILMFEDHFRSIVAVSPDSEIVRLGEWLVKREPDTFLLVGLGEGIAANDRMTLASEIYGHLHSNKERTLFSSGVLRGITSRDAGL